MAVTEGSIRAGDTAKYLDMTVVTNSTGDAVHRETVVIADPETNAARVRVTSGTPVDTDYGVVTKSQLYGANDAGDPTALAATAEGHLEVAVHSPRLPFGSVHVESLQPVFQIDPVYGVNTYTVKATTGNAAGGAVSSGVTGTGQLFTVATGTTAFAWASMQTRRRLRYRPGQGVIARFAGLFTGRANSAYLLAGVGTAESGYYFGYAHLASAGLTSSEFGIFHVTGGVREIRTLTLTGNASSTADISIVLNSATAVTVALTTGDTPTASAYKISLGTFPGWSASAVGGTVVFLANDAGSKNGTYTASGAGYLDSPGGPPTTSFARTLAGVASTDTFYPKSTWNGDKLDGTGPSGVTLDPSKGNVYQIGIQYLGFGSVTFQIEAGLTGNNPDFVTVHTLNFPNTLTATHVSQPSFPFTATAYSAGSTTDLAVKIGSLAGFTEGRQHSIGPRLSFVGTVTSSTTGYVPLFTVRNESTYQTRANQTVAKLLSMSGAAKSNQGLTTFYLIRNATLSAGTPSFSQYSTTAPVYVDTAATACTFSDNGQIVFIATVAESGDFAFGFTDREVTLQPGETMTLAVKSVTATAVCFGGLNMRVDL